MATLAAATPPASSPAAAISSSSGSNGVGGGGGGGGGAGSAPALDAILLLEQPFAHLPYDQLRTLLRTQQRLLARELELAQSTLTALAAHPPTSTSTSTATSRADPAASAADQLDATVKRLRALKRRLAQLNAQTKTSLNMAAARYTHLHDLHTIPSTAHPAFDAWSRTRLDRILVDYMLRHGANKAAANLTAAAAIPNLVDTTLFAEIDKIEASLHPAVHTAGPTGSTTTTSTSTSEHCARALAWCAENRPALEAVGSRLEFDLRMQVYIELARTRTPASLREAITYLRTHLIPMQHEEDRRRRRRRRLRQRQQQQHQHQHQHQQRHQQEQHNHPQSLTSMFPRGYFRNGLFCFDRDGGPGNPGSAGDRYAYDDEDDDVAGDDSNYYYDDDDDDDDEHGDNDDDEPIGRALQRLAQPSRRRQVSRALGLLACAPASAAYADLYHPDRWASLRASFRACALLIHALPPQPMLHIALSAGLSSLKQPACYTATAAFHEDGDGDVAGGARSTSASGSGSGSGSGGQTTSTAASADVVQHAVELAGRAAMDVSVPEPVDAAAQHHPLAGASSSSSSSSEPAPPRAALPALRPHAHAHDDDEAAADDDDHAAYGHAHAAGGHRWAALSTETNPDCPICERRGLGVLAREVPWSHHENSTIVCRLGGHVMSEDDPPMCLPNGRVYSRSALEELAMKSVDGRSITDPASGITYPVSSLRKMYIS